MKDTGLSRTTMFKVQKIVKEEKDLKEVVRTSTPRKINVDEVKEVFMANPKTSMTKVAEDMNVYKATIRHKALKEVGDQSLRMIEIPLFLNFNAIRCKVMLNDIKHAPARRIIIFSDEKKFTVDPVFNRSSDRVMAFNDNRDIVEELRTINTVKHPASVMMFGATASNRAKMDLIWFKTGFRLKSETYLEILKEKVLP
ncbi:uncharacterized protein [Lepeophtheirus salmonis]|uniref:uncharacterized protein n=1 Tax=Lepeophtheirus salmonis TaxID=72036 RepID=UPI001AE221F4|nr:uncharacterized protein LOC121132098 [Lepeophtheirus salmonis]